MLDSLYVYYSGAWGIPALVQGGLLPVAIAAGVPCCIEGAVLGFGPMASPQRPLTLSRMLRAGRRRLDGNLLADKAGVALAAVLPRMEGLTALRCAHRAAPGSLPHHSTALLADLIVYWPWHM